MSETPQNGSYTASEAAAVLDLSKRRVLQMLKRGELRGERDPAGRWSISTAQVDELRERRAEEQRKKPTPPVEHDAPSRELVEVLQAQVEDLRRELEQAHERDRENRRIIAALTSRIPELPAPQDHSTPSEATGGPEAATGEPERVETAGGAQEGAERPWWRRVFGNG